MCILCIEVAKEQANSRQFWRLFKEVNQDDEHFRELMKVVTETSEEYQTELANGMQEAQEQLAK